jgi:hypothetical protein
MRKIVMLLTAAAFVAAPLSQSFAAMVAPRQPVPVTHTDTAGPWIMACGAASALSLIVGSEIKGRDADRKKRRQLTVTEAAWHSAACPFLLPLAGIAQATCPDNKATYTLARLAWLYADKHPGADQSAFTNAYAEACHTGKLSHATLKALKSRI